MEQFNPKLCDEKHKVIDKRFDTIEKRIEKQEVLTEQIHQLTLSLQSIAQETKDLRKDFNAIIPAMQGQIKDLEAKPIRRYEKITETIIVIIISVVLGFVLASIGIK